MARRPWRDNALAARVLDGLTLDNDESWMEACRRYKAHVDEQKRQRQAEREKREQPSVPCCWFCLEPKTTERLFFGDRWRLICEVCVDEVAANLARERAARLTGVSAGDFRAANADRSRGGSLSHFCTGVRVSLASRCSRSANRALAGGDCTISLLPMSAIGGKADMPFCTANVRF